MKKTKLHINKVIPGHLRRADGSVKKKGNMYVETVKFNLRIGVGQNSFNTSVTLRKNIVALWILIMDKAESDPYIIVQEFIEKVCLKRWTGDTAKGMSDFITKCMIHDIVPEGDFVLYKKIYLSI